VVTHGDEDHIGGLSRLAGHVPVAELWIPDQPQGLELEALVAASTAYGTKVRRLRAPAAARLGSFTLEVLGPVRRYAGENDGSIVLLVQSGTLRKGDIVLAGLQFGRVRAMLDENGKSIDEAGPSIPVEILGLDGTPDAGDQFAAVESERRARELADFRQEKSRDNKLARQQAAKLDNMFESMTAGEKKTLNLVVKADVRGSLEAIQSALLDLGNEEVQVNIVSGGVGGITETDVTLSMTSNAVIFGFNVRADNAARRLIENEGVDLRYYNVIYDLIDDVKQALTGMLAPELREEIVGIAEVRDVFRSPKFGQIAGCMVTEGTVYRSKPIRVLRDNVVIYTGKIGSLKRFKDDVSEVKQGYECGIGIAGYNDLKDDDVIESFVMEKVMAESL